MSNRGSIYNDSSYYLLNDYDVVDVLYKLFYLIIIFM